VIVSGEAHGPGDLSAHGPGDLSADRAEAVGDAAVALGGAAGYVQVDVGEVHHGEALDLWVPETRLMSCNLPIFREEAAEPVVAADAGEVGLAMFWERA
jgi:hypothetical protein